MPSTNPLSLFALNSYFKFPSQHGMEAFKQAGQTCYQYQFDYKSKMCDGAAHALELGFVFGTLRDPDAYECVNLGCCFILCVCFVCVFCVCVCVCVWLPVCLCVHLCCF